jgi:hypothetical protein
MTPLMNKLKPRTSVAIRRTVEPAHVESCSRAVERRKCHDVDSVHFPDVGTEIITNCTSMVIDDTGPLSDG